jgi:hypothetical protein
MEKAMKLIEKIKSNEENFLKRHSVFIPMSYQVKETEGYYR